MSLTKYILRTIRHYLKLNFTIVLGIALSTAILVGALIIGDSVRYSLQQITVQQLGKTSQVITAGERLFGTQLAEKMAAKTHAQVAPVLRANGFGVVNGGELRINQLAVWGIDKAFGEFSDQSALFDLKGNEVAINENLASFSGLKVGDQLLLRLNKLNTFPANTPFVSEKEATVSFQVSVAKILRTDDLGNFNLKNIQSAPRNVFLNLDELNRQMGLQEKANVLLFAGVDANSDLPKMLQESWSLADLNLTIRENQALSYTELISDRVFVEPAVEQFAAKALSGAKSIFSYFVNDFTVGDKQTPYSFVSTDENLAGNQIAVSEWLADDLKAKVGDAVKVSYFEVGPLRRLVQKDTTFVISSIFRMEGAKADPQLAPVIPGLSDAGNCRDWKTGVPVDLKKIRPNDEGYWNKYKGTPKAYISAETARKLWRNRFGEATAIRVEGSKKAEMEAALLAGLIPSQVGFEVTNVKSDGMAAAAGGTDFGGLFIGLSFFVLFAAVLLAFLLFKLSLNFRRQEIGTLTALGFSLKQLRKIYLAEASVLIIFGIALGLPFAIFYNNLILKAVNTVWVDIVRTSIVNISIQPMSLLVGSLSIALISIVAVWLILNRFLNNEVVALQKGNENVGKLSNTIESNRKTIVFNRLQLSSTAGKRSLLLGLSLILLSLAILFGMGFRSGEINPDMFFTAGFGFLPGLILLFDYALQRLAIQEKAMNFSVKNLLMKRIAGERRRNVMIVSFLSVGVFMVVSTGLYRKDLTAYADLPSSGTGGYDYFVETTMPVLFDVNSQQGREDLNLPDSAQVVQFQVQQGDDASCLNLNKISRPRLMAFNPAAFDERVAFTFATRTDELDAQHPWATLNKTLAGGVIPAIADQTVIQWGLMKSVGDTLMYKTEDGKNLKLKLVGGLANSIFQGNVLISEEHFNRAFPSVSGSNVFLVDVKDTASVVKDLQSGMRNYGPEISRATDRLLSFYTVENTYLNIFLMLGALGLLIGTLGLGILIFRITFEQIPEYALLLSLGFSKASIQRLVMREKFFLMLVAVLIGLIPAVLSGLPTLLSSLYAGLWIWLPAISILVILSGTIFSLIAIRMAFNQNLVQALRNE